jgi:hypothetical protein
MCVLSPVDVSSRRLIAEREREKQCQGELRRIKKTQKWTWTRGRGFLCSVCTGLRCMGVDVYAWYERGFIETRYYEGDYSVWEAAGPKQTWKRRPPPPKMLLEGQLPEPLHHTHHSPPSTAPHRCSTSSAVRSLALPFPLKSKSAIINSPKSDSCPPARPPGRSNDQTKRHGHGHGHGHQRRAPFTSHLPPHFPPACSHSVNASACRREIMPPTAFLVHQGKASYSRYMWISAGDRTYCACCRRTTIFHLASSYTS